MPHPAPVCPDMPCFFLKGQKACFLAKAGKWGHIEAIKSSQMVVGNRNVMTADIHIFCHSTPQTKPGSPGKPSNPKAEEGLQKRNV